MYIIIIRTKRRKTRTIQQSTKSSVTEADSKLNCYYGIITRYIYLYIYSSALIKYYGKVFKYFYNSIQFSKLLFSSIRDSNFLVLISILCEEKSLLIIIQHRDACSSAQGIYIFTSFICYIYLYIQRLLGNIYLSRRSMGSDIRPSIMPSLQTSECAQICMLLRIICIWYRRQRVHRSCILLWLDMFDRA